MEGTPLLPGSLDELAAAHPEAEAEICCVGGHWYGTVRLPGGYGYLHADDEAGLLARLAAALG